MTPHYKFSFRFEFSLWAVADQLPEQTFLSGKVEMLVRLLCTELKTLLRNHLIYVLLGECLKHIPQKTPQVTCSKNLKRRIVPQLRRKYLK